MSKPATTFLSPVFGLAEFGVADSGERLRRYRRFLYETSAIDKGKGAKIGGNALGKERMGTGLHVDYICKSEKNMIEKRF